MDIDNPNDIGGEIVVTDNLGTRKITINGERTEIQGTLDKTLTLQGERIEHSHNAINFDATDLTNLVNNSLNSFLVRHAYFMEEANTSGVVDLRLRSAPATPEGISEDGLTFPTHWRATVFAQATVETIESGSTIHYIIKFGIRRRASDVNPVILGKTIEKVYNEWTDGTPPAHSEPDLDVFVNTTSNYVYFRGTASDSTDETYFAVKATILLTHSQSTV